MSIPRAWRDPRGLVALALVALATSMLVPGASAATQGLVDGSDLIELVGEDAVTIEVTLQGPLLKMLAAFDADLETMAAGLESIKAVVIDLEDRLESDERLAERLIEHVRNKERRLIDRGWERIVVVREEDSDVRVLVLSDEDAIRGLVVMVVSPDDGEVIFTNIAGTIDLRQLARLGEAFDLPGLDDIEIED